MLEIMSSNVSTTFITCPADPQKTLGIKLPFLVMIVKVSVLKRARCAVASLFATVKAMASVPVNHCSYVILLTLVVYVVLAALACADCCLVLCRT